MKTIELDELKSIQLKIMQVIDDYCHKNHIPYYICSGTLIGAVRHKGYIPWDDDIDICMFRKDYDNFFREFNKNRKDEYRAINSSNTSNYYLISGKVVNTNTVMDEYIKWPEHFGVYVDVFQLDNLPNKLKSVNHLNRRIAPYRNLLALKTIADNKGRGIIKNAILKVASFIIPNRVVPWLIKRINNLSQKYKDEDTFLVGDIGNYTYGEGEILERDWFDPPVRLSFEGMEFDAPNQYDKVLKQTFGNYMELPPKERQKSHHLFAAFWKE